MIVHRLNGTVHVDAAITLERVRTWLDLLPEWQAVLVIDWLDVEQRGWVSCVGRPPVQLHLTTAAAGIHHHTIAVALWTCGREGGRERERETERAERCIQLGRDTVSSHTTGLLASQGLSVRGVGLLHSLNSEGTAPGGEKWAQTVMAAPRSSREMARRRRKRGEHNRAGSRDVEGAFTHSGGEGGRRRKILERETDPESMKREELISSPTRSSVRNGLPRHGSLLSLLPRHHSRTAGPAL